MTTRPPRPLRAAFLARGRKDFPGTSPHFACVAAQFSTYVCHTIDHNTKGLAKLNTTLRDLRVLLRAATCN